MSKTRFMHLFESFKRQWFEIAIVFLLMAFGVERLIYTLQRSHLQASGQIMDFALYMGVSLSVTLAYTLILYVLPIWFSIRYECRIQLTKNHLELGIFPSIYETPKTVFLKIAFSNQKVCFRI